MHRHGTNDNDERANQQDDCEKCHADSAFAQEGADA